MTKNTYANMTDAQLLKKKKTMQSATLGLGIVAVIAILISSFIIYSKGFENIGVTLLPVFILPIIFLPLFVVYTQIQKEVKYRNL